MYYFIFAWVMILGGLLYLLKRRKKPASQKLEVFHPNTQELCRIRPTLKILIRRPLLFILGTSFLALLGFASSRPQKISTISADEKRRNLMLTLDLSGSMDAQDFILNSRRVNRLEAVKVVVKEFIENRPDDRIGLVVFGTNAYLQSPLTLDHEMLATMVDRLQVGIAGDDTAIGDGLGLSLKRIQDIDGEAKAIILLTDGANKTGRVNPLKAANIAKDLGIKIHTIGIGSKQNAAAGGFFSRTRTAEFDEESLQKIADISDGVYFNASSIDSLREVYAAIDKLEKTSEKEPDHTIIEELFPAYVTLACIIYFIYIILSRTYFQKIP